MLRPTSLRSFVVRMRNVYRLGHAGGALISGVSCGSPVNTSFPDYGAVSGMRDDPDMLVMSDGARVVDRRPTKPKISAAIANLQRGDIVIVERVCDEGSGDWYVQVLMREDNTFQLEYRDGAPAEHYQTRTVSREKVVAAVLGWVKGEPGWKVSFLWNNIASCFEGSEGI